MGVSAHKPEPREGICGAARFSCMVGLMGGTPMPRPKRGGMVETLDFPGCLDRVALLFMIL